jgi:thousand and one amino acid protein kinase
MPDTADEQTGGESSKSNSITSEHSIQSIGVSASSHSSSTNSTPNMNEITNMSTNDHYPPARNRHKVLLIYYYYLNALHKHLINL